MFDLTMTTPLVFDDGEVCDTTLAELFQFNHDIEDSDHDEIITALETEGAYAMPAGASAAWTLTIKDPR